MSDKQNATIKSISVDETKPDQFIIVLSQGKKDLTLKTTKKEVAALTVGSTVSFDTTSAEEGVFKQAGIVARRSSPDVYVVGL